MEEAFLLKCNADDSCFKVVAFGFIRGGPERGGVQLLYTFPRLYGL